MPDNKISNGEIFSRISAEFPTKLSEEDQARLRNIFMEFAAGFSILVDKGPFVTVFGSSRIDSDKPEYQLGVELGRALARMGLAVLTGGGPGLMEAVNKGAHEANGRSVGVNIAIPEEQQVNPYANPAITINHFFVRKVLLLKYSTAYVFLPGGYGTLDEFFETVTLMQTRKTGHFPLILIKREYWSGLMDWIRNQLQRGRLIGSEDMDFIYFADTVDEAMGIIRSKAHLMDKRQNGG